ncbi:hypothetical protein EU538_12270 [Candidatus Thorarchaeota archaeon]|nr:MAG: hypothetical protein EU538_12270 [Candidatus Thorarchaeota archaeon]
MRFEGSERIELADSTDWQTVRNRIAKWRNTRAGHEYRVIESAPGRVVLERTWTSTTSIVCIVLTAVFTLSIHIYALLTVGLPLVIAMVYLMQDKIRIEVLFADSTVDLYLGATQRAEAEWDLDSLVNALGDLKTSNE